MGYPPSMIAISSIEDWENLVQAFMGYGELVSYFDTSNINGNNDTGNNVDGPLSKFRLIAEEIIDCVVENDYGHYFEDLKLTKYQEEEITRLSEEIATICRKMHENIMQNADNQVLVSLQTIFDATNIINEGDNIYEEGTRTVPVMNESGNSLHYEEVGNDLGYYFANEDTVLGKLYKDYKDHMIKELETYKPEGYDKIVKGLKKNPTGLYIGDIGAYNRKLAEDDWGNYIDEIMYGITLIVVTALIVATSEVTVPIIASMGLSGGLATLAVKTGYMVGVGYTTSTAIGSTVYNINVNNGSDGYALDGTYLSEESRKKMFNEYVIKNGIDGAIMGLGSANKWIGIGIDISDIILAIANGDDDATLEESIDLILSLLIDEMMK